MNLVINAQLHRTQQSASLIFISRSASALRGRTVWGRGRAREAQSAAATRSTDCGRPRAGRQPQGPRRGSAAARSVVLLGRRCRLLQPSSQRRAAPGVRSTFSRSFAHAAPREGSLAHTHTTTLPPIARSLAKIKNSGIAAKGVAQAKARQRCADLGAP